MNAHSPIAAIHPSPMRPGAYLRLRREADGYTIEQLVQAGAISLASRMDADKLVAWWQRAEADEADGREIVVSVWLRGAFRIDPEIYEGLLEHHRDPATKLAVPRACILCGCSYADPCTSADGDCCAWIPGLDLCSACPVPDDFAAAQAAVCPPLPESEAAHG